MRAKDDTGKAPYAVRLGTKQMPEGLNGPVRFRVARAHVASQSCWCGPTIEFVSQTGVKVLLHKEVQ